MWTWSSLIRADGTGGPEREWRETRGRRNNWRIKTCNGVFIWGGIVHFWEQDPNAERCMKAAAAVQDESSAMASPRMRNKELPPRHHWIAFSGGQIEWNLSRNQNLCLNIRHEAARTPWLVADDPSALPSPTFSPSSRQQLFFSVHLMPAPVCQLLYFTTVLLKVCTVRFKSFISCLLFMYYLCGKYI